MSQYHPKMPDWVIPEITKFKCYLRHPHSGSEGDVPEAMLHLEGSKMFICQNVVRGNSSRETLGYEYSYEIWNNVAYSGCYYFSDVRPLRRMNHEA